MVTLQEYAILSARVYRDARGQFNVTPLPPGWTVATSPATAPDPNGTAYYTSDITNGALSNGLSAEAYRNGNDIVIAFKGTDFLLGTNNGQTIADLLSDLGLGIGGGSQQLLGAAMFYAKIKAENPTANITFTGHSLGAGLASIMSVWFNEPANIFADAPFYLSSINGSFAKYVLDTLQANGYAAPQLTSLIQTIDNGYPNPPTYVVSGGSISARETNVTSHYVQGEVLNHLFGSFSMIVGVGQNTPIEIGGGDKVSAVTLHSIVLHAALLLEDKLRTDTLKLPDLISMIFDEKLFANKLESQTAQDLLSKILNDQIALIGGNNTATGELTRFATDLEKLTQANGLTLTDENAGFFSSVTNNVSRALTAFAMQKYYSETPTSTGYNKQLYTDLSQSGEGSNGVRFDIVDVTNTPGISATGSIKADLSQFKGYELYFKTYLTTTGGFTPLEQQLITSLLPYMRDWYVQAGSSGMLATDALNRGAFMLGGKDGDALVGGTAADLLVGNAGDDILQGGKGSGRVAAQQRGTHRRTPCGCNDTLLGGAGNDAYVYTTGDGFDTILDSDGLGSIAADGNLMTGGDQYGDNKVFRAQDANGTSHLYTFVTGDRTVGGDLIVDGAMLIKNYRPSAGNHLGISFADAVTLANPVTTRDIVLLERSKRQAANDAYDFASALALSKSEYPCGATQSVWGIAA